MILRNGNLSIVLNREEEGNAAALVVLTNGRQRITATLCCALQTGLVGCFGDETELTTAQYRWLESQQDKADLYLYGETV